VNNVCFCFPSSFAFPELDSVVFAVGDVLSNLFGALTAELAAPLQADQQASCLLKYFSMTGYRSTALLPR